MSNKSVFESKSFKKFMTISYGVGAAIVIIGALFKILHLPGADMMLIVGMGTEAVIFLISAFEPVHQEWDWSLVYPQLAGMEGDMPSHSSALSSGSGDSVSQQLDKMLEEAKIGPELIESFGTGLRSLSDNVGQMANISNATIATDEYAHNVSKANESLNSINTSYGRAIAALDDFASTSETVKESANKITNVGNSLEAFDKNIKNLNAIYGGMLNAMKVNN